MDFFEVVEAQRRHDLVVRRPGQRARFGQSLMGTPALADCRGNQRRSGVRHCVLELGGNSGALNSLKEEHMRNRRLLEYAVLLTFVLSSGAAWAQYTVSRKFDETPEQVIAAAKRVVRHELRGTVAEGNEPKLSLRFALPSSSGDFAHTEHYSGMSGALSVQPSAGAKSAVRLTVFNADTAAYGAGGLLPMKRTHIPESRFAKRFFRLLKTELARHP